MQWAFMAEGESRVSVYCIVVSSHYIFPYRYPGSGGMWYIYIYWPKGQHATICTARLHSGSDIVSVFDKSLNHWSFQNKKVSYDSCSTHAASLPVFHVLFIRHNSLVVHCCQDMSWNPAASVMDQYSVCHLRMQILTFKKNVKFSPSEYLIYLGEFSSYLFIVFR